MIFFEPQRAAALCFWQEQLRAEQACSRLGLGCSHSCVGWGKRSSRQLSRARLLRSGVNYAPAPSPRCENRQESTPFCVCRGYGVGESVRRGLNEYLWSSSVAFVSVRCARKSLDDILTDACASRPRSCSSPKPSATKCRLSRAVNNYDC